MKLKDALKLVPKLKGVYPALNNIKLEDGVLTWSDLRTTMSVPVDDVPKSVKGLVDPKILSHTVESLDKFTVSTDGSVLVVGSANGEYRMPLIPTDDFPVFEEFESKESVELNGRMLSYICEAADFASSDWDTLNSVNLSFGENLRVAASNSYVLYMATIPIDAVTPFEVNIPKDVISHIPKNVVSCTAYFGERFAVFDFGEVIMRFRLWDGMFPEISFLLSYESVFSVSIKPGVFLKQIAPLKAYVNSDASAITLRFQHGIDVTAENIDYSVMGRVSMPGLCNFPDEYFIKINYNFLSRAMSVFDTVLTMDYVNNDKPLRLYSDDKFLVVMPIM